MLQYLLIGGIWSQLIFITDFLGVIVSLVLYPKVKSPKCLEKVTPDKNIAVYFLWNSLI